MLHSSGLPVATYWACASVSCPVQFVFKIIGFACHGRTPVEYCVLLAWNWSVENVAAPVFSKHVFQSWGNQSCMHITSVSLHQEWICPSIIFHYPLKYKVMKLVWDSVVSPPFIRMWLVKGLDQACVCVQFFTLIPSRKILAVLHHSRMRSIIVKCVSTFY